MAAHALREAERFLYLHPHATTDVDNPVELLRGVVAEAGDMEHEIQTLEDDAISVDELAELNEELARVKSVRDRLIAFARKLREQEKISDFELRLALGT